MFEEGTMEGIIEVGIGESVIAVVVVFSVVAEEAMRIVVI